MIKGVHSLADYRSHLLLRRCTSSLVSFRAMATTVADQAKIVRELKQSPEYGPNHETTQAAIAQLLAMKKESAPSEPSKQAFTLKVPKGTKDWSDSDMVLRESIFNIITKVFKKHRGVAIDTPVFELREILAGKYGEDSKLIYDLQDQGGELCSLRYDLTVPFARWLAMNSRDKIKRYHIAKVYRRDQPAMTKGRMREFYQCDFDIAGQYESMVPDSEVLRILTEALTALEINDFTIKLNHRKILDGIFQVCGVPNDKIRTISSAVDKLDKLPWDAVRREMIEEKQLDPAVADRIGTYVVLNGDESLLEQLKADTTLSANPRAKEGMNDLETLFRYLRAYGNVLPRMKFDLSLARGLDYYTGIIYEAVTPLSAGKAPRTADTTTKGTKDVDADRSEDESVGVGSIAAGGRYDELVGMFSNKSNIPCVGISIGVERVFSLLKERKNEIVNNETVYVMAIGKTGLLEERMAISGELWDAGIEAEILPKRKPLLKAQFEAAEKIGAPIGIIIGDNEKEQRTVNIKMLGTGEKTDGETVQRSEMVDKIRALLENLKTR